MRLLSICIPTYNRISILKSDVETYLSLKDERFCIKVVDNCSTDSTYEYLKNIKDNRLIIKRNSKNIGPTQNMFISLQGNDSKYSLLILDKDLIDVNMLPGFLNELEEANELFGFIDPDMRLNRQYIKPYKESLPKGYDSIYKMAYLNMHPSGYLYNSQLIDKVCSSSVFLSLDKDFVFPFEVINASLALDYDSFIFRWPIIIRAREREVDPLSITYNQSNVWFSAPQRLYFYCTYLEGALRLNISLPQKKELVYYLTVRVLNETTLILRSLMKNDYACTHYRITQTEVGFKEMHRNILCVLSYLKKATISHFSILYINLITIKLYLIQNAKVIKALTMSKFS